MVQQLFGLLFPVIQLSLILWLHAPISIAQGVADQPAVRQSISKRIGMRLSHPDQNEPVWGVQFSADDTKVLANTYPKNKIQVWDAITGHPLSTIDTVDEVKGSASVVVPNADFTKLYTWVGSRGKRERIRVNGVDGFKVAYPESRIQVWQTNDGKLLEEFGSSTPGQISHLSFPPDKKFLWAYIRKSGTWFGSQPTVCRLLDPATNQWSDLPASVRFPTFSPDSQWMASFEVAPTDASYTQAILVSRFPTFSNLTRIELSEGIHSGECFLFDKANQFLIAQYRTYPRRDEWKISDITLARYDLNTGELVDTFRFPYTSASPLQASRLIDNRILAMTTWVNSPEKLITLDVAEMKVKWEVDLGDFEYVREPVVSPNNRFVAVICTPKSENNPSGEELPNWDLLPLPQMKLYDCQTGELMETLELPVGSSGLVFSNDGRTAAIAAVGAIYFVDFANLLKN